VEGEPPLLVTEQGLRTSADPWFTDAATNRANGVALYRLGNHAVGPGNYRRLIGMPLELANDPMDATARQGRQIYRCPRKSCRAAYPYNTTTLLRAYAEAVRTGRREILAGVDV